MGSFSDSFKQPATAFDVSLVIVWLVFDISYYDFHELFGIRIKVSGTLAKREERPG